MHFSESNTTSFSRFNAPTGQASTQPLHAPLHVQLVHFPSFQQHFL
jgi:hypothetical protein